MKRFLGKPSRELSWVIEPWTLGVSYPWNSDPKSCRMRFCSVCLPFWALTFPFSSFLSLSIEFYQSLSMLSGPLGFFVLLFWGYLPSSVVATGWISTPNSKRHGFLSSSSPPCLPLLDSCLDLLQLVWFAQRNKLLDLNRHPDLRTTDAMIEGLGIQ